MATKIPDGVIELTARYAAGWDGLCWVLYERARPTRKNPEGRGASRLRYFPRLEAACRWVLEAEGGDCRSAEAVVAAWERAVDELPARIDEQRARVAFTTDDRATIEVGADEG